MRDYATRSICLELCSIETGVVLIFGCVSVNRILVTRTGGLASLRKARRNINMKKTAAPQTLANAIANGPITPIPQQGKGQDRTKSQRTEINEM
jgi:hypothetical protein